MTEKIDKKAEKLIADMKRQQKKEQKKKRERRLKMENCYHIIFNELRKTALSSNGGGKGFCVDVAECQKRLGLNHFEFYEISYRARIALVKNFQLWVRKQTEAHGRIVRYVYPGTSKDNRLENEIVFLKDMDHIHGHLVIARRQLAAMDFRNQLPEARTAQYKKLSAVSKKLIEMGESLSGTAEEIKEKD